MYKAREKDYCPRFNCAAKDGNQQGDYIYNTKTQRGFYGLNHIEQKYQRNWYW